MTAIALTLPMARRSPIHIPRRDLVLDYGDSLRLRMALVQDDSPGAAPINLAGVGLSVRARLLLSRPDGYCWDYGQMHTWAPLYAVSATVADAAAGLLDFRVASQACHGWPGRLGYSIQLIYFGDVSLLCAGVLQIRHGHASAGYVLTDGTGAAITTATGQEIGASV